MTVSVETVDSTLVISLQGRLDGTNSKTVESDILGRLQGGPARLALDLSLVDYISSAGLRVVLVVAKRLKQPGSAFILYGIKPHIREIFEISGFLSILDVATNRDEALAQLSAGA